MSCKPVAFALWIILLSVGLAAFGQTAEVSGVVVAADRQPLAAASIGITETGQGAQSNEQGMFQVRVPANRNITLVIRYVGIKPEVYLCAWMPGSATAWKYFYTPTPPPSTR